MPVYSFESSDGETISVLVTLDRPDKERREQTVDGKVYKRVYSAPLAARDLATKDGTAADFKRITEGKNVKVGDLWEISKEMSHEREQKQGRDEVREKFHDQYEKETGKPHPERVKRQREEANEALYKQWGVRVQ